MAKVHTESNVVSCTKYLILTIIVSFFIKSRKDEKKKNIFLNRNLIFGSVCNNFQSFTK